MCYNYSVIKGALKISDDSTLNKLILLYVFEAMDVPLTGKTILEMCTSINLWLTYMDCTLAVAQLQESGLIFRSSKEKTDEGGIITDAYYSITPDGRMCLDHFYTKIPSTMRTEITEYVKANRMAYRRKQEYYRNYYKNPDGTYTVHLKIVDPVQTTLELKLNVTNRDRAKQVYNKWEEKAAQIYYFLHEELID